ncbi:hypothetical protein CAEBREN_21832 [Caenorhabditis brenneri]|uniref:Anaphase-promoting complex subunit 10 n=1 Tax=Caenorhabditis brenneri TaxID=135651 RepID=G0MNH9_CAEBE|nr:hypothetical protein CAEBREN_21832 [Caenorhabditis brenneri]
MDPDEAKRSDGSSGWLPFIPKNIHTKDRPLLDISSQAVWALSSCKNGYGVDELLSDNVEKYWQSDGPQPHTILLEFQKKTDVAMMMFYFDFKNDESYTPSKHVRVLGPQRSRVSPTNRVFTGEPHGQIPEKTLLDYDDEDFSDFVDHSLVHLSLR